jgi:hypothetical protein
VCETVGLKEVADYWYAVVSMNDLQKQRFVERVIGSMFNTIANKRISIFGFAFKKDTGARRSWRSWRSWRRRRPAPRLHAAPRPLAGAPAGGKGGGGRGGQLRRPRCPSACPSPSPPWLPAGDTRETPAIDVCRGLIKDGAKVCIYDPKVTSMQIFTDLSTPKFEWDRPRGWNKSESAIMQSVEVGGAGALGGGGQSWREGSGCDAGGWAAGAAAARPAAVRLPRPQLTAASPQTPQTCQHPHTSTSTSTSLTRPRQHAHTPTRPRPPTPPPWQVSKDHVECVNNAHAICVLTEWDEFKSYDYQALYNTMVKPAFIFDGRNILDHAALREIGFIVYALGKPLDPFLQKGY